MVNDIGHEQYHQKDLIWSPSWRPRLDSTRRDGHCGRWVKCGGIVVAQNVHSPHGRDRGGGNMPHWYVYDEGSEKGPFAHDDAIAYLRTRHPAPVYVCPQGL